MSLRLKEVSLAGFRGFSSAESIPLDADVVVISGVNGSGKTSLMDSILWALTGSIPRLGDDAEILSRYSPSGEARVELLLLDENGSTLRVVRRFDGEAASLSLQRDDGDTARGPVAESGLLQALWPDAELAQDPWDALSRSLTRGVYLQQDSVRDFVEADGEEQRFRAVGEMVGAGRAGELSNQLAAARTRWSRATNSVVEEAASRRARLTQLKSRIEALDDAGFDAGRVNSEWNAWRSRAAELLGDAAETGDRARYLDRTLTALQVEENRHQRTTEALRQLESALENPVEAPGSVLEVGLALDASEAELARANSNLEELRAAAAEERRRVMEAAEAGERLATMAAIALEHLDDACPVCGQDHDASVTRERLSEYLEREDTSSSGPSASDLAVAAAEVQRLEQDVSRLLASRRELELQGESHARWTDRVSRLAADAGLEGAPADLVSVSSALSSEVAKIEELSGLRDDGEALGLTLARLEESSQRASLEAQIDDLEAELHRMEVELASRAETTEVANQLLEGLRTASEDLVKAELARMEPLLQRIYSSVDPHPSFRAVNFLTRTVRGKGRLWTPVADVDAEQSVNEPSSILSSSQLNVLAVATFLALNLSVDSLPLGVVSLDDPLQSLDDVNLLGLADLIRRVRGRRQVIVSTHDDRLSGLLRRKLRPIKDGERTISIDLAGWSRTGPVVQLTDVSGDSGPLRLVS